MDEILPLITYRVTYLNVKTGRKKTFLVEGVNQWQARRLGDAELDKLKGDPTQWTHYGTAERVKKVRIRPGKSA